MGFEIGSAAPANEVEAIAGEQAYRLIAWGVFDGALAGEFELPVGVAPIEPQSAFGQGHAELIGGGVREFAKHPNLAILLGAVFGFGAQGLHPTSGRWAERKSMAA
jgi:hypothetical protein